MYTHPPADSLKTLVGRCRQSGLRKTVLLEKVLQLLLHHTEPVTIQALQQSPDISNACDPATLYRLLARLESNGIVRRIGLHERAAHYILNSSAGHHDYVVCVDCGEVRPLDIECPVGPLEEQVSRETGFENIYHELQFYGRCPKCKE